MSNNTTIVTDAVAVAAVILFVCCCGSKLKMSTEINWCIAQNTIQNKLYVAWHKRNPQFEWRSQFTHWLNCC